MRYPRLALAIVCVSVPAAAVAQTSPGSEFRLNSYATGTQQIPSVSADGLGNFVVVWEDQAQENLGGVFARRFSASGRPLGPEFHVNAYTTNQQQTPQVAVAPDGRALVIWNDIHRDGDLRGVFARRLDAAGRPVGDDFQVNVYTTGFQNTGSVAADENGGFLVAWNQLETDSSFTMRVAPDGTPLSADVPIGAFDTTSLARRPGGGWVAVGDDSSSVVSGVLLDESGAPVGPTFQVNTYTMGDQTRPQVAVDASGAFVVAWNSRATPTINDIRARRFDAQGRPLGADFQVSPDARAQTWAKVGASADGGFIVTWTDDLSIFDTDIWAQRYAADGTPRGSAFTVNQHTGWLQSGNAVSVSKDGQIFTTWTEGDLKNVSARMFGLLPQALVVDPSPAGSNGNGVLEPGEAVRVEPTWANRDQADWAIDGHAAGMTGPGSPGLYSVLDASADYGFLPDGSASSCSSHGDCYRAQVAGGGPRPADHWDVVLEERLSNGFAMHWPLHVGGSFADVPVSGPFYRFVETLFHRGITAGCAPGTYCGSASTSREQMAVLVLAAAEGAGYRPPACTTAPFGDVAASSPYCPFIQELSLRGVVGGCGGGNYCPSGPATRQEMAVFVLRAKEPQLAPPACVTPQFADVPADSPFCRWVEELARRNVVSGCGGGNYCPVATVTREQVAVFIAGGFGLTLYGP